MKRFLCAAFAAFTSLAFGATLTPVQLLNPAGSSSGQVIVSTGASTAPGWANVAATALTGITPVANGGTGLATLAQYNVLAGNATGNVAAIGPGTAGWVLTSNGGSSFPSFQAIPTQTGRLLNVQVFSSGGTYTPTAGTSKVIVEVQASGGGGGGVSATGAGQAALAQSGGAGAYAKVLITSGFSGATITMPAGGAAGTAGANAGATASAASFGSIVSCPGGIGGNGSAAQTPPFLQSGAAATSGCTIAGASTILSVVGRAGFGQAVVASTSAIPAVGGFAATAAGSGGNGAAIAASASAAAGSAGITGYVVVYEYN
ncbi:hypothetical protein LMG28727_04855 [Paraburkholderia kirstenboschensis]|uniref:hypothetical protein n=1 Tax=Paraburkholderia kirstenboschensis TaxID=1245436 RepID=UPI001917D70D|nr:hypothetical protein [Paraburkholderia kirstenboschensis]CAD6548579.1 hypothetical protein LMG28727_04855 [Paraburkholderia kirstenboschensis]